MKKKKKLTQIILLIVMTVPIIYLFIIRVGVQTNVGHRYPSEEVISAINEDKGEKIFNHYNFGGYLIGKLDNSEKKIFIDGRMPSWSYQGKSAFKEYIDVKDCLRTEEILDSYNPDIIVWPKKDILVRADVFGVNRIAGENLNEKEIKKENSCNFIEYIEEIGWEEFYSDKDFILLKRKPE